MRKYLDFLRIAAAAPFFLIGTAFMFLAVLIVGEALEPPASTSPMPDHVYDDVRQRWIKTKYP